jgi:hypothetical protein
MEFVIGYNLKSCHYNLNRFRKDYILSSNITKSDTNEAGLIKDNPCHLIT